MGRHARVLTHANKLAALECLLALLNSGLRLWLSRWDIGAIDRSLAATANANSATGVALSIQSS